MTDSCIWEDCCIYKAIREGDIKEVNEHIKDRERLARTRSTCDGKNCIYDPADKNGSRKRIHDKADKMKQDRIRDHFK